MRRGIPTSRPAMVRRKLPPAGGGRARRWADVTGFIDGDDHELDPRMVRALMGPDADRVSLILFGAAVDGLDESQMREIIEWSERVRSDGDLRRHVVRDLSLDIAALVLVYGGIDRRLGVRPAWGETGYLDVVVDAQAVGTVGGYEAMCEGLEASWHDMRLTVEEGIAVVEAVERVRTDLRRLEACGAGVRSD